MFSDDTNIFLSHKDIKLLFETINCEMAKRKEILSFHPSQKKHNTIPLRLPELEINKNTIERETMSKFVGVILDENLTWKSHINPISTSNRMD